MLRSLVLAAVCLLVGSAYAQCNTQTIDRNPRGISAGPILSVKGGTSAPVGDDVPTLDFLGNTINFERQILTGHPSYAGTRVFLDNYSHGYAVLPWGGYPDIPAFQATATSHSGSNGTVTAIFGSLISQGDNPFASQDQAIAANVLKTGQNSTWGLSIQNEDNTGRAPGAFAGVGEEIDILGNGPDDARTLYNPNGGGRFLLFLAAKVNPVQSYGQRKYFHVGDLIARTPTGGVPTVFIAQTAGFTGEASPNWPTAGTVGDGGVSWMTGSTYAMSVGNGIWVGSGGPSVTYNNLIASNAAIGNAGIDFSTATLAAAHSAGIRLAPNMPVDFSGNGTAMAQNMRVLQYTEKANALTYAVKGSVALSIADTGLASFPGQVQAPLATPKSSSSPCVTGTRTADANYEYVCVATNKWKRAALSDF